MRLRTHKQTPVLGIGIDVLASETIRGTLWVIRPWALSLSGKQRADLYGLLENNARLKTGEFHTRLFAEWERPGNEGLSSDELFARSSSLREAYRQRREAEALFVVLCRDIEQNAPKRIKGARPC